MKKVLITGAHGFIAQNVSRTLKDAGFFVIGTSRRPEPQKNYDDIFYGLLGEPLKDVFDKHRIDVVVHCAYDSTEIENIKNAEGTCIWAEQAEKNDVGLQIFMSSISADQEAFSPYGQKKYEVEKWFLEHNHIVFRLGLVVGNGGLFGKIISLVKKNPVIPLIDRGRTSIYVSDADTIGSIVTDSVLGQKSIERGHIWFLQQETPLLFIDVLREIRRQYKRHCIFIPVPYTALSILLNVVEKLKFLKIGIDTNNLKGMRQVSHKSFKSDLSSLGYKEIPLDRLIRKTLD